MYPSNSLALLFSGDIFLKAVRTLELFIKYKTYYSARLFNQNKLKLTLVALWVRFRCFSIPLIENSGNFL